MRPEERMPAGRLMPPYQVRDERLAIALHMLQLTVTEGAAWPVAAQQMLRQAVRAVQRLQAWCKAHGPQGGGGRNGAT